jgi:hypothetical protein
MAGWPRSSGYHCQSIAENAGYRRKPRFGDDLARRLPETQVTEAHARITAMNVMT